MKYKYGNRIKELRTSYSKEHMSMDKLVEKFKQNGYIINKSMISRWENGLVLPDQKHIIAYAKVFNVDINYLMGLTDVNKPLSEKIHIENDKILEIQKNILKLLNELNLEQAREIEKYTEYIYKNKKIEK